MNEDKLRRSLRQDGEAKPRKDMPRKDKPRKDKRVDAPSSGQPRHVDTPDPGKPKHVDAKRRESSRPDPADSLARAVRADARGDPAVPRRDAAAPGEPEARPSSATRELLASVRRQQKLRREQELEEAKRLQEQAKALQRRAKESDRKEALMSKHQDWVARFAADMGFDPDRAVTEVPALGEGEEEVHFHAVREGQSYIRIVYDNQVNAYDYQVIEPVLNHTETEIMAFLRDTLVRTLEGRRAKEDDWEAVLMDATRQAILDHSILIDDVSTQRVYYHLVRDFLGYGPIDALMRDPMLEDISCDGPGIPIYVFHRRFGSMRTTVTFPDEPTLDSFVIRLAQRSGKHISIAEPLLDATLPDGSRLQTTLSKEVTTRGSSFTIRRFRGDPFTPPDLVNYGTMGPRMAAYFWMLVEHGSSLIMAGGTASGKTTTLNAICQFVPPEKKVVSIEDTREINLMHENWIAGVTRSGFGGGTSDGRAAGAIDMYRLLEAALRQRPEYLIVGEVRGAEALTLFQAMATGHTVYSTMHADSVASAVYRLENEPINVPRLMLQTLDVMAIQGQVRVKDKPQRRIIEVTEIVGFDPDTGELLTNRVFQYDAAKDQHDYLGRSHTMDVLRAKMNMSEAELEKEWDRRVYILEWMRSHGVRDYRDVARIVTEYYKRPEQLVRRLESTEKERDAGEQVLGQIAGE